MNTETNEIAQVSDPIADGSVTAQEIISMILRRDPTLIFTDMKTGERVTALWELYPALFQAP